MKPTYLEVPLRQQGALVCGICGALVHHGSTSLHDKWHQTECTLCGAQVQPGEGQDAHRQWHAEQNQINNQVSSIVDVVGGT